MLILATYPSSHAALAGERRLKAAGAAVELIPVPRQIRSSCGFCLLVEQENADALRSTGPESLWLAQAPAPGALRRTYVPIP